MDLEETSCCGVKDFVGLCGRNTPPKYILEYIGKEFFDEDECARAAFVLFTCPHPGGSKDHGKNLKKFIEKHDLGPITASVTKVNPNSTNPLKVYVWAIGITKFRKWYKNTIGGENRR